MHPTPQARPFAALRKGETETGNCFKLDSPLSAADGGESLLKSMFGVSVASDSDTQKLVDLRVGRYVSRSRGWVRRPVISQDPLSPRRFLQERAAARASAAESVRRWHPLLIIVL